ncbi:MAG: hypothetical protein R3C02_17280 [Planctomycetaceae bacterium]
MRIVRAKYTVYMISKTQTVTIAMEVRRVRLSCGTSGAFNSFSDGASDAV